MSFSEFDRSFFVKDDDEFYVNSFDNGERMGGPMLCMGGRSPRLGRYTTVVRYATLLLIFCQEFEQNIYIEDSHPPWEGMMRADLIGQSTGDTFNIAKYL